jgi:nitrite reductase/ring-hydroxylating ferredoxin subunit
MKTTHVSLSIFGHTGCCLRNVHRYAVRCVLHRDNGAMRLAVRFDVPAMSFILQKESTMPMPARRVAQLSQLRADRAERVVVDGENILLIRDGDTVRAYAADCPHAGGPLEQGALCNGRIICPWHKATFQVATGGVLEPPALVALDRYRVVVTGDDVMVTPEKLPQPVSHASSKKPHFVVIGAGAAGAAACAALRECGFTGAITLVGDEPHAPYDRTALSKFVPSGEMSPGDVPPLLAPDWLERHDVERIVAKVARLDVPRRTIHFETGGELVYDTALLATGSVPKIPSIPGCDTAGVHVLRTLDDAAALVDAIGDAPVAILGSSFIGLETDAMGRGLSRTDALKIIKDE